MSEYIIRPYDSADNASLAAAIPVMGEKSGRSRDFAIATGDLPCAGRVAGAGGEI